MSSPKLQSLQGLRGIAIILVIIFHLFPKKFVSGFVGVDMFFVLSGYLMTRILSKKLNFWIIIDFYKKRFNRIVPLYYFTIFSTILGVLTLVLQSERKTFITDIIWSMGLISNLQSLSDQSSYWEQVSSIRFLTHLWSVCVELQYYLLAPIVQYLARKLHGKSRIFAYFIAIFGSLYFQLTSPTWLSYSFLVSRIWQFLMGSVAFEWWNLKNKDYEDYVELEKNPEAKKISIEKMFPYGFLLLMVIVMMAPGIFEEDFARIIMTLSASFFCYLSGSLENTIFTNFYLVFIGNISYVMYLVHWPIINFLRYIQQRDHSEITGNEALIAIILILVTSIIAHYFLEQKILNLNFIQNFLITLSLLLLCFSSISLLKSTECLAMKTLSTDNLEKATFNLIPDNIYTDIPDFSCDVTARTANFTFDKDGIVYCAKKGTGNGTILIIGNSLAMRAFPLIFDLFDNQYQEIRVFAKNAGAPLLNMYPYFTDETVKMTKHLKPDLLWIIQGNNEIFSHYQPTLHNYSTPYLDKIVPKTIKRYQNFTKSIFVDLPYYLTRDAPSQMVARGLIYRKNLDLKLSKNLEEVEEQVKEQRERLRNMNCGNCEFIDVQKALINGKNKYNLYQEDTYRVISYDGYHISKTGYELVKPVYKEKIDMFLTNLMH